MNTRRYGRVMALWDRWVLILSDGNRYRAKFKDVNKPEALIRSIRVGFDVQANPGKKLGRAVNVRVIE